jgi:hypothetical protein
MITTAPPTMRELHSRTGDGIHVRLLWSEQENSVLVTVVDTKGREDFTVEVREGDRPLDVFHHPYAYAAARAAYA